MALSIKNSKGVFMRVKRYESMTIAVRVPTAWKPYLLESMNQRYCATSAECCRQIIGEHILPRRILNFSPPRLTNDND